jgi:hypothetical protein
MNTGKYLKILEFAGLASREAQELWRYMGTLTDMQSALVIAKQKELLKDGIAPQELSAAENGIAYLLKALKLFYDRTNSTEEYITLADKAKAEFVEFDRSRLETIARRKKAKKPSKRRRQLSRVQEVVTANVFKIYSMYANGYTWTTITQMLNDGYHLNMTREAMVRQFRKLSKGLPDLSPARNSKSAVVAKSDINRFAKKLRLSLLERSAAYIAKRREAGAAYRKIAEELTSKHNIKISYMEVYRYCLDKSGDSGGGDK